jgi:tetratricopeptide (TPR) repeat protein
VRAISNNYLLFKITLLWLLFGPATLLAQVTTFEEASNLFEQGKYREAYPYFRKQAGLFPKEPKYQYYCGVCLVQMRISPEKALAYLLYAAERPVPRDVYFFLGQLYISQYQIPEAEEAFAKFKRYADSKLQQNWDIDLTSQTLDNTKKAIGFQTLVEVIKTDTLDRESLLPFYNKRIKLGKFVEKTTKGLILPDGTPSCFFQPELPDGICPLFEPIRTKTGQIDLSVLYLNENKKGKTEVLGTLINTPYNEGYAWFSSATSTLYYASCGPNSLGGFDIFRSIYNPNTHLWSVPESLGFPINTPADDYLFVFDETEHIAWFTSNRGVSNEKVVVYTLSYSGDFKSIPSSKNSKPVDIARLLPVKKIQGKKNFEKTPVTQKQSPPTLPAVKPEQVFPSELSSQEEYNQLISQALQVQVHGDSLARAANELRLKLPQLTSETEKEKCKKNISWLDYRAQKTQMKADSLYEKARNYELGFAVNDSKNRRNSAEMSRNAFQKSNTDSSTKENRKETSSAQASAEVLYEFKVMASSPYKTQDDIPMDQPIPQGIVYRIQMGAFSQPIAPERFKGIMPLFGETLQNGLVKKYYAGNFSRNSDAEKALNKVREYGFRDAYLVSYYNGKTIPVIRAKDLEKNQ